MVRHWLSMTLEDDTVIHVSMRHALGCSLGVLYLDDGLLGSLDLEWIHGFISVLISLFRRIGLMANFSKSKAMVCQSGAIQSGMLQDAIGRQSTGKGAT